MKSESFPSLTDYFNYYIAGFCWLICGLVVLIPKIGLGQFLTEVKNLDDNLVLILSGILLVIIPYVIGFIFTPVAELATWLLRLIFGDPRKIVIYDNKSLGKWNTRFWKKRISKSVLEKTIEQINLLFSVSLSKGPSKLDNWHGVFLSYIIEHGRGVNFRVIRTRDLVNFTESILIPLPLFFILLAPRQHFIHLWGMRFIGFIVLVLLAYRYLILRKYLTMQIYRAMLVLTTEKKQS